MRNMNIKFEEMQEDSKKLEEILKVLNLINTEIIGTQDLIIKECPRDGLSEKNGKYFTSVFPREGGHIYYSKFKKLLRKGYDPIFVDQFGIGENTLRIMKRYDHVVDLYSKPQKEKVE